VVQPLTASRLAGSRLNTQPHITMPYGTKTLRKGHVRVYNKDTGRTLAKDTTPEKAEAQQRLLAAIKHNPGFRPRKK